MSLNNTQLNSIAKEVYQKFPELHGVTPEVQSRQAAGAKSLNAQYLLIFKGEPPAPKGLRPVVRVTADAEGKVLKISTSR